jgi:hypothetical protein
MLDAVENSQAAEPAAAQATTGRRAAKAMSKEELIISARAKIAVGGLMTLAEVAALFDIAQSTVYALPLPSIRIGRSLRFDPRDVTLLIELCREPASPQG